MEDVLRLIILRLLLLLAVPGIATPPEALAFEAHADQHLLTYDNILMLIDAIEQDELEGKNPEEVEQIAEFLCLLAEKGAAEDDPIALAEIRSDSYELCCGTREDLFRLPFLNDDLYSIQTAVYKDHANPLLCKSWASKQCKSVKKFTKKHKKAILIGAIVVVAVVAVTIAAVAIGAGAASSAAAIAGAAAPSLSSQGEPSLSPIDLVEKNRSVSSVKDSHELVQAIENKTSGIKTALFEEIRADQFVMTEEESNWLFAEKARELGSVLAHELLDGVTSLISPVPQFFSQVKEAGSRFLPEGPSCPEPNQYISDPLETFNETAMLFHEKIDDLFGTDRADLYSPDAEEFEFAIGMPPLPGTLTGIFSENSALLAAGKAADRGGLTKAGRALMKHGYRENSPFPKPLGNPQQVNIHGERILAEILNNPGREVIIGKKGEIKIYSPDGRGAYFRKDGTFRGFIEKQYEEQIYN